MKIFDELKKKSDLPANLALEDNHSYAVLVSDIEEVLSKTCKWKQVGYEWKTECGEYNLYQQITDHFDKDNWKYCPYCGKLIEGSKEVKNE